MDKLKPLIRLEESLAKLPGIGKKSAERMAFNILEMSEEDIKEFADAVTNIKKSIHACPKCGMLCNVEDDVCEICSNQDRDQSTIMVVAYPKDVISIEKSGGYKGLYHVLNGELSISKNIPIESLNTESFYERLKQGNVKEVIFATNPTLDGETTALYLNKVIEELNINTTRLAYGLTMGSNIDYTDQLTLLKALEGRRKI